VKKRFVIFAHLMIAATCMAGPNTMAILQIRDLNKATEDVSGLAEKLQLPMPPGIIQGQIGMLVMSPAFTGIDASKPITIYVNKFTIEQDDPPDLVVRFSVTGDGSEYLTGVEVMAPGREEVAPGVSKFIMGDPADADAPVFYAIIKESQALVGQSLEAIKALSNDLTEAEKNVMTALPGEVSVSINVAAISELISTQMKQQKETIESYKKQMEAEGMDTSEMFKSDPTVGLDSMSTMMTSILEQLELLVLNVDLNNDVTIRTHAQATPNSTLAAILEETVAPSTAISGYKSPNALFYGFGTMGGMDRIIEPYAEWVASIYKEMGPPMDGFAESYKQMMIGMKGVYTGGFNLVVNPPQADAPLQLAGLYEIADKEKARQSMKDMMKIQEEQSSAMSNMPYAVTISSAAEEPYKGVEIETYTITYDFKDEMIDEAMPEPLTKLFSNMKYSLAYMDNYLGYSFGAIENIHQLIDYTLGGGAPVPHRPGFSDLSEEAISYWNLDVAGLINAIAAMLPPEIAGSFSAAQGIEASIRGLGIKELGGFSSLIRLTESDLQGFMQIGMSLAPKSNGGMPPPSGEEMMMFEEETDVDAIENVETAPAP